MLNCSNLKPHSLTELVKNTKLKVLKTINKRLIIIGRIEQRRK